MSNIFTYLYELPGSPKPPPKKNLGQLWESFKTKSAEFKEWEKKVYIKGQSQRVKGVEKYYEAEKQRLDERGVGYEYNSRNQ